jgi:uncharacterized protein
LNNAVTQFEIYAEEPAKLADFYRSLFGWQLDKASGLDYWRIQTTPSDGPSFNRGLLHCPVPGPRSSVHYVHVASVDEAMAQVRRLGGSVLREKTAVPKTAWYAVAEDPEGNIYSAWVSDPMAFPPNGTGFRRWIRAVRRRIRRSLGAQCCAC